MIGLTSANELGKKAYLDGIDLYNSPSYLNAKEQEAWRQGYEDEMHAETVRFQHDDEDIVLLEDINPEYMDQVTE